MTYLETLKSLAVGLVSSAKKAWKAREGILFSSFAGAAAAGALEHQNFPMWVAICAGLSIFGPGAKLSINAVGSDDED